jgi:hypothetical protein
VRTSSLLSVSIAFKITERPCIAKNYKKLKKRWVNTYFIKVQQPMCGLLTSLCVVSLFCTAVVITQAAKALNSASSSFSKTSKIGFQRPNFRKSLALSRDSTSYDRKYVKLINNLRQP